MLVLFCCCCYCFSFLKFLNFDFMRRKKVSDLPVLFCVFLHHAHMICSFRFQPHFMGLNWLAIIHSKDEFCEGAKIDK